MNSNVPMGNVPWRSGVAMGITTVEMTRMSKIVVSYHKILHFPNIKRGNGYSVKLLGSVLIKEYWNFNILMCKGSTYAVILHVAVSLIYVLSRTKYFCRFTGFCFLLCTPELEAQVSLSDHMSYFVKLSIDLSIWKLFTFSTSSPKPLG